LLKQNQKIKQKSHEWTIKNLYLWFSNFMIFITTFLWILKSKSSNFSTDWADNNLNYHQFFLKKQLLIEFCFLSSKFLNYDWNQNFNISILSSMFLSSKLQLFIYIKQIQFSSNHQLYFYNYKHVDYLIILTQFIILSISII